MNTSLKISILANAGLVALVLWMARGERTAPASAIAAPTPAASIPVPLRAEETAHPIQQQRFQWSQLESTNYSTYIANLRAIGCPDQTVRDIITADLDSVFAPRREQLRQQTAGSPQALATGLQELRSEEAGILLALLGPGSDPALAADAPAVEDSASPPRRSRFADQIVTMPLVFQDPGPETQLNPTQLEVINGLRESFKQEMSGVTPDPNDPEYRRRWQAAQSHADQMLSAMLGSRFMQTYQMQARDQAPPSQ